jgi:hypothetical protein
MMFSSNTCRFVVCFLSLSLSATAETVRGVHRELEGTPLTIAERQNAPVVLGTATDYVILASAAITTTGATTINGDIAVSPIDAGSMTGFDFTYVGTVRSSAVITGGGVAEAASDGGTVGTALENAVTFMEAAYTNIQTRPAAVNTVPVGNTPAETRLDIGAGTVTGVTFNPGLYTWGTLVTITGDITFDGSATDIFIIQIAGYMTLAANKKVILKNGALAKNIFWQVSGYVTVGAGAEMKGNILCKTAVTFVTGSQLEGRAFAQTAVTLQEATIIPGV